MRTQFIVNRDVRSILDNLSFVMEDMSRNLGQGIIITALSRGTRSQVVITLPSWMIQRVAQVAGVSPSNMPLVILILV